MSSKDSVIEERSWQTDLLDWFYEQNKGVKPSHPISSRQQAQLREFIEKKIKDARLDAKAEIKKAVLEAVPEKLSVKKNPALKIEEIVAYNEALNDTIERILALFEDA